MLRPVSKDLMDLTCRKKGDEIPRFVEDLWYRLQIVVDLSAADRSVEDVRRRGEISVRKKCEISDNF